MNAPFIIAEMSANHLGGLDRALAIVDAAADAGCDAVKLQTWDRMSVDHTPLSEGPWKGRSLVDLYDECKTPWAWHRPIFERAAERGIMAISTPFDAVSADFLDTLGCPMFKIASFEITDLELIRHVASKGRPMLLSTGMAHHDEIAQALHATGTARYRDRGVTLLKCTSAYPAKIADANLLAMESMKAFGCHVGLSDHTLGTVAAVAAVALGATVIEKHLTLLRADGGPDAAFSAEPDEMTELVTQCRAAAAALGDVRFGPSEAEQSSLHYRRSLWSVRGIRAGRVVEAADIQSLRPATGAPLSEYSRLIGMRALVDIPANTPVRMEDFGR
tara:strand:- start:7991 stop:8986 length:996 start_codon:yes stop_codon:yes gene_type:complete